MFLERERHAGEDHAILAARHALYLQTRELDPAAGLARLETGHPSRTRLHHKDAFGGQPYSAVGCMTEATTTLTRAGAHPESLAWWDTYDEFQSSPPEFGGRIIAT